MMADGVDAQSDDDGGRCGCAIRWMAGKWRTSGTQSLVSRRIPARYAALCIPGYGRVPSLCDERVQTGGCGFYNRSSAVDANGLASRGRQANPVLTYKIALRRFFAYGDDASRRWGNPMDGGRCGCAIRWVMADDVVRQAPKDGCIIVAPGWLAYLGLVVERGIYRRRAVV